MDFIGVTESDLSPDPITQFISWFEMAKKITGVRYPEAACLSTVSESGDPEGRMVLIKYIEDRRFVFFTNLGSPKIKSIRHNPKAALTFYWPELGRQVRMSGSISQVSRDFASEYFDSRHLDSQIGATVSHQSHPLESREKLMTAVEDFKAAHVGEDLKRPVFWSGFELNATMVEFWQEREFRLHDRFLYTQRESGDWVIQRLYP